MQWRKRGLIFEVDHRADWMWTHAELPAAIPVDDEILRIFFSTRDGAGRSRPTFIDVRADDPSELVYVHDRPVLELGPLGAFDDAGVMASSVVAVGDRLHLFYAGWSTRGSVPYHVAIGLATSDDGGKTFTRSFTGPLLERSPAEPFFVTAPCVLVENGLWRMWYSSGRGWVVVDDRAEPLYDLRYAESEDGLTWRLGGVTSVGGSTEEAISRPCVLRQDDRYSMWYSYRGSSGYRSDPSQAYRIGYAESEDGIRWNRKDDEAGMDRSAAGWDSVMTAYPFVYEHGGRTFMLYNGNGFGRSGLGYATLEQE